ncbi:MAG: hypothetical protein WA160_12515 [Pseudobdellovibrio sp.]
MAHSLKDVFKLSYVTFNTSNPGIYSEHCHSAYQLWKKQWTITFKELGTEKLLTSDDFIDRELCGLFDGHKAIGIVLFKFMDLKYKSTLDTAYFKNYPTSLLERNYDLNDTIMVMSYMTIDPLWRKLYTNFSVSELLFGFLILNLNCSKSARAICYLRNNRSTNEIFYRHSGTFLESTTAYNVAVDFAEADSSTSTLSTFQCHALLNLKLWNNFYQQRKNYESKRSITSEQSKSVSRDFSEPALEQ